MGAAIYVSLERDIDKVNSSSVDGKALLREMDALDALAKKLGVTPLYDFYSGSADQVQGILSDEEAATLTEHWFSAKKGIESAQVLLENLDKAKLESSQSLKDDLKNVIGVLTVAQKNEIRFHFSIDV